VYPGSHGTINVSQALQVSCNYFFFDAGRRTGIDNLVDWAHRFGLGHPTGIEIEESLGYVAGPETSEKLGERWYPGQTLSTSIGQDNNQFTPVQIANYIATIANGGTLYKAHLLKEALSYDYSYEYHIATPEPVRTIGLSSENLAALQAGMRLVTLPGGTAYSTFRSFPIPTAGKTGSAQVGDRPNNGVFVVYAPYENPQVAVSLVVEKGGAGSVCSWMARDILTAYFQAQEDRVLNQPENGLMK